MLFVRMLVAPWAIVWALAGPAQGATYLETATLGLTGRVNGPLISVGQAVGARFTLSERIEVTRIGGHVRAEDGSGPLYAAVIPLPGLLPAFALADIETAALGAGLLAAPAASEDVFAAVSLVLEPGDYALLFGSGRFGATGIGDLIEQDPATALPGASFFFGTGSGWFDGGFSDARFVVDGNPAPLAGGGGAGGGAGGGGALSAVPLPGGGPLLAASLLGAVAALRRGWPRARRRG